MISIMYFRLLVGYGYYRDNIVYRDNLKNTMKTYRDIAFSIIAQPYYLDICIRQTRTYNICRNVHVDPLANGVAT